MHEDHIPSPCVVLDCDGWARCKSTSTVVYGVDTWLVVAICRPSASITLPPTDWATQRLVTIKCPNVYNQTEEISNGPLESTESLGEYSKC